MPTHSQYSCLKHPMDRGTWRATVHGGHKESDRTERLNKELRSCSWREILREESQLARFRLVLQGEGSCAMQCSKHATCINV